MKKTGGTFTCCTVLLLIGCAEPVPTADPAKSSAPAEHMPVVVDEGVDSAVSPIPQEDRSTVPWSENGPRYTWSIIPAPNGTYGFAIYDKGRLYIDQQRATGLSGADGWKLKTDAREAALKAMEVLESGGVPDGLNIVGR